MARTKSGIIFFVLFLIINNGLSTTNSYNNSANENNYYNSSTTCPPWFVYDKTTEQCKCGSDLDEIVNCDDKDKRVYIVSCFCIIHDNILGTVAGSCRTNCFINKLNRSFKAYYKLPTNLTELKKAMCEDHWNRRGRLCGRCKDGYHPLVYSYDMRCVECRDDKYNWLWFIVATFVPLTIFFILGVTCGLSASSPQLEAFVAYAQIIASPPNALEANIMIDYNPSTTLLYRFIFALYGIWNLDFFCTLLPPICLKLARFKLIAFYTLSFL